MKHYRSLLACLLIAAVVIQHRATHVGHRPGESLKVTDWDVLGYYLYLPGTFIYHDLRDLKWIPAIESQYAMSGGIFYQALKADNGVYVSKYLGGVAILQAPFFAVGHWVAVHYGYPPDGFSPPYQWAIAIAGMFYGLLGLFILRRFLLRYFTDGNVAIALLLLCLGTNYLRYAAVDNGQSHVYIFPLYALVLHTTYMWHRDQRMIWAILTGYIIGLATICRPTEAVMLFIPLMWGTHTKEAAKAKWGMVKQHRGHVVAAILAGFVGILPQLIYWKHTAGTWIYDVGSAWHFLTPHLRVLFGFEKGWFIYTPVTVFFIVGLFFIKRYEWRKSVLWFCLLNIDIIISWADWRYGGSYSTRALMQSYPVFALPLTAFVQYVGEKKWRWAFYAVGVYLVAVNLFQHEQYHKGILHFYDMNRKYYGRIYLNPNPTPLDYSLMDNEDFLKSEDEFKRMGVMRADSGKTVQFEGRDSVSLFETELQFKESENWLRIDARIKTESGIWNAYLNTSLQEGDSVKHNRVRLFRPNATEGVELPYSFYVQVPKHFRNSQFKLYISRDGSYKGELVDTKLTVLSK